MTSPHSFSTPASLSGPSSAPSSTVGVGTDAVVAADGVMLDVHTVHNGSRVSNAGLEASGFRIDVIGELGPSPWTPGRMSQRLEALSQPRMREGETGLTIDYEGIPMCARAQATVDLGGQVSSRCAHAYNHERVTHKLYTHTFRITLTLSHS